MGSEVEINLDWHWSLVHVRCDNPRTACQTTDRYKRSRNAREEGPLSRLSKDLGLTSMLFAAHSKNPESDMDRIEKAMKHSARYPPSIESMLDTKELLIQSQPSTSAHTIHLRSQFRFESDEKGLGKRYDQVSDVNLPRANHAWNFTVFDPRASAVLGDHVEIPATSVDNWISKAFYASPESTRALPRFCIELIRNWSSLVMLLRDETVPFASSVSIAHTWLSGVLEDGISSFPKHTIPLCYDDTNHVKHARWPKLIQDIVDEVDIGVAHLSPTINFYDATRRLHERLCRELSNILDGDYADLLDIRLKQPDGYCEAYCMGSLTTRSRLGSPTRPQSSTRMQGARRYSTARAIALPTKSAFIALGSNTGDRLGNIEAACRKLASDANITLRRTSGLWQTKAMYVTDQDDFLNGVCEVRRYPGAEHNVHVCMPTDLWKIETTLEPVMLLDTLQAIENKLGRKRLVAKGPRTLDLDMLLYANEAIDIDRLTVPHKLMFERHFVLEPLCE